MKLVTLWNITYDNNERYKQVEVIGIKYFDSTKKMRIDCDGGKCRKMSVYKLRCKW